MICAVYKSRLKADSYLFVEKRNDFERVPEALLAMFGAPELVMIIALDKRQHLGIADINKVKVELEEKGYYLQLPPPPVNLLEQYKQEIGYSRD